MPGPIPYSRAVLDALNFHARFGRKHIYAGTVPADEIARRRAKDKAARVARRVQRRRQK